MTYQQWLADAAQALNQVNPTENGKVDALVLLQHATGKSRTQILAFDETEIDEKVRLKLTALLDRRLKGEPIAYILGEKEFWSLPLNVSEGTLIPRPDTEILVEKALHIALEKLEENPPHFRILDLGTGTGAIALALASELSPICQKKHIQLDVIGVDLMPEVVKLAQSNAEKNQLKVQFLQSRWFENVEGQFDIIVSNPPYVTETEKNEMDANVLDWEPGLALFVPDEDPLRFYNRIACLGSDLLLPGGKLYFEINQAYGRETAHILEMNQYRDVRVIKDIFGKDRIVTANR